MHLVREIEIAGRKLTIETGRMAKQADGAVTVRYGDTVVLVTACADRRPKADIDFVPLTVDYRENTYAGGKIPGGFFKREGRPNEKEILTSRLIDRPIRPLFPEGWNCETQVIALVLSYDQENDPDTLAVIGASAALHLSDIPFPMAIAAVRVGLVNDEVVVNPTEKQMLSSRLDLVVAAGTEDVVMVEAGASEVTEAQILEAIRAGQDACRRIVEVQQEMFAALGRTRRQVAPKQYPADLHRQVEETVTGPLLEALSIRGKIESYKAIARVKEILLEGIPADAPERAVQAKQIFEQVLEKLARREILKQRRRFDQRGFDQIRPITCEVGILPRTHGSALFTRGETQALVTVTLGTSADAQKLDWLEGESQKRFMLHYNFPPFSVGEVKFLRGPGRREIGHGALAERALKVMIPEIDTFPYTLRLVSDILESNGSSSMASICGGTLALLDAGVPLRAPIAGIAMGLMKEGDDYAILSDIAGVEDHYGDMDFKIAGTSQGITAVQMDIKVKGISAEIMRQALAQARDGRLFILDRMMQTISQARENISVFAPRMITISIPKDKIREVIGPGGKMIRSIVERTGAKIEINDDGRVEIASVDEASARMALEIITELTTEAEVGKSYMGKVKRLVNFGAFVEILPGLEGLLHVSEIAPYRVNDPHDELAEGDEIMVKVIDVDGDRVRLSRRALLAEQGGEGGEQPQGEGQPRAHAHSGSGGRPGGHGGGRPHGAPHGRDRGDRGGGGRPRRRR
ncbi:MAG TPA: polyribonucleotide nucleotidyltransferase [Candidatus Polarisedimenticolia bacterium]|nr:polyribonucleotide nucleotidyltransferase [Candidatus Polarisedimenticolia bacterium]